MSLRRACVVGAGPNGLTAAIVLAKRGVAVDVLEASGRVGGGAKSETLTLPGFIHDVCSAAHPMAAVSPAFESMPLREHGLRWITPPAMAAHPLDGGRAALLENDLWAAQPRYRRAVAPLSARWPALREALLAPLTSLSHPLVLARFGLLALPPASWSARTFFPDPDGRALFAGLAAHSVLPLESPGSSAVAWALALAGHAAGWPVAAGGSQKIADALAAYLRSLGGKISLESPVRALAELSGYDAVLCDVTPAQLLRLAGDRLPAGYRRALSRWRYGPGVFKMDWALDGPIPWAAPECARAATVHLGGAFEEIAEAERAPWAGRCAAKPFVLLTQPSLFDPARAPEGRHTAWAYCHVPNGCAEDMTSRIEAQLERFAPGFRDRVLGRHAMGPAELERRNANLVGGDITGGAQTLAQTALRPTLRHYRTPVRGLYLCSSSTPPGAGVHGMCGWHAARAALADFD